MTEPPDDLERAYRGRWLVRVAVPSAVVFLIVGGISQMLRTPDPELDVRFFAIPALVLGVLMLVWWVVWEAGLIRRRADIRALVAQRRTERQAARRKPHGTTMASGTSLVDGAGGLIFKDETPPA